MRLLRRGKSLTDTPFLPSLTEDDNVDFENKKLYNVGSHVATSDVVNMEYIQKNRMTVVHLIGKLSESNIFKISGLDDFKSLYDGQFVSVKTSPATGRLTLCLQLC